VGISPQRPPFVNKLLNTGTSFRFVENVTYSKTGWSKKAVYSFFRYRFCRDTVRTTTTKFFEFAKTAGNKKGQLPIKAGSLQRKHKLNTHNNR